MSEVENDPRIGVKITSCPTCGRKLDAAWNIEDESLRPAPGDFTVCSKCITILRFDEELEPVPTVAADLDDVDEVCRIELITTVAALQKVRRERQRL